MQSNIPFRVARGLTVVVAIVVAHFVIVWLFQNMKLRAPDLGPVYATIGVEPGTDPESPAPPAPAHTTVNEKPQKAPPVGKRERPAAPSASDAPDEPRG